MPLDPSRARQHLRAFNLSQLFIEELGWDRPGPDVHIDLDGAALTLAAVAQKRGLVVLVCPPLPDGRLPDHPTRRRIEFQVRKAAHEHLIIFTNADRSAQKWQWVRREPGKPTVSREYDYVPGRSEEALIQRLQHAAFAFEEEEGLTILDTTSRVRAAFDVERVTKRFYERFKSEHDAFMRFLEGIPEEGLQRWYVSVTLNRLMFVYFIQKKQFLNDDLDYLRTKLTEMRPDRSPKTCQVSTRFYREFLCPLFFEGFAVREGERSPQINRLLGHVPYLNGGIFARHQLEERYGQSIQIADAAFERLFDFFEQYRWNLDERPLRADNEINPDVLGYIFEKYINQKQMGAYYTKEDITGYIVKYTVLPYLLDQARERCKIAFEGPQSVWRLLSADPDRYIYPAVRHGVDRPLPPEIAIGLDTTQPGLIERRKAWNKPAPAEYALPTEIWREVVARRQRYEQVWARLVDGELRSANDLITYNLDIQQFAQDVVESSEGPELVRAFWRALQEVKILDPTCGSGAFLFAALNILEPLYEACLERMAGLVHELEHSGAKHRPEKLSDLRQVLADVARHPNRRYFILKTIIVHNLYGVDIMEEAVEICKLRLFLKLVAQIENVQHLEPLPDIDFNIRAGNTLVGFTSLDEVRKALTTTQDGQAVQTKMIGMLPDVERDLRRIQEQAEIADRAYRQFQAQQVGAGYVTPADKAALRARLDALDQELHRALARTYGIDPDSSAYAPWLESHKPFHWLADFYGIMAAGGFDVIIGNPPYVEYSRVKGEYRVVGYKSVDCDNLYVLILERSLKLAESRFTSIGMIVPVSVIATPGYSSVRQALIGAGHCFFSTYNIHPCCLFEGANPRLCITILRISASCSASVTRYHKWYAEEREHLFNKIAYYEVPSSLVGQYANRALPKIAHSNLLNILIKLNTSRDSIGHLLETSRRKDASLFYRRAFGAFLLFYMRQPRMFDENDVLVKPTELKQILTPSKHVSTLFAVFNSSLFYIITYMLSDCRNVNKPEVESFPFDPEKADAIAQQSLTRLGDALWRDLVANSTFMDYHYKSGRRKFEAFYPRVSKPILDEIDKVLAQHYGFSEEELDFILNYDIKYRMGAELEGEEEA